MNIEPTKNLEDMKGSIPEGCLLYSVGVEGGNDRFYDKYGGEVLRPVLNTLRLILQGMNGIRAQEVTSRYGDVHVFSNIEPIIPPIQSKSESGEPLEVRLVVSQVE